MPESAQEARFLCDAAVLEEGGDAVTFEVLEHGSRAPAFALRYDIKVEARVTAKENIAFNIPRELRTIEAAVAR